MSIELAERVQKIHPSPTLAVSAKAQALRAEGRDIISLGTGEPDFDTPDHVKEAAIEAIKAGFTKYTAVDGIAPLKKAIINKLKNDNQLEYGPDQILVSVGGKQSFFNLCQALIGPEDEVIIPAPYWVSYPDIVRLADGEPVIIPTTLKDGFKLTPEQLNANIAPETRLVVLNSPSNPTGVAYDRDELKALAEVLIKYPKILIATDDMYEHILFEKPFENILTVCPELYDQTIVLNGVSKAYAMTGWRIGYAAGPADLIKSMKKIQSQSTSNPTSIAQVAAQAALEGDQSCVKKMVKEFKKRHDYVHQELNALPGINCLPADGTFYLFPNVEGLMQNIPEMESDVQLAERILEEAEIALVPGSAFGAPGHLRFSFATSMAELKKGDNQAPGFY